uniref:Uncharacterized protein n=1 Tax=Arundo donax TaxID=35708 RepID=A0A0A9BDT1_ARUDO
MSFSLGLPAALPLSLLLVLWWSKPCSFVAVW